MAKKFGKQRKGGKDPRDLFGAPAPPPRSSVRPASSTPLADYLAPDWPGVDENYVVLPRSLAEGMSIPWQQQMSALLAQFHQTHAGLSWPVYRVVPSRYENLVDLDEEQLAEAGYLVEIDADGELCYRERSGRKVEDPANTRVLVSVLDPIAPRRGPRQAPDSPDDQDTSGASAAEVPPEPPRPRAVPMNIPPAPVWRSTPTRPSSSVPPLPGVERAPSRPVEPPRPAERPEVAGETTAAEAEQHAPLPLGWEPSEPGHGSAAESASPEPGVSPSEPHQEAPQAQTAPQETPPAQQETRPVQHEAPPVQQEAPPVQHEQRVMPLGWEGEPPPSPWSERAARLEPQRPQEDAQADEGNPPHGQGQQPGEERGWFDEFPEDTEVQFGPTGQPTELPYRYRP